MKNFYCLKFDRHITSFNFYNEVLKDLHEYFQSNTKDDLILDFTNVDYIDVEVIPILLTTGCMLKDYFGTPVPLFVPWKPRLLSYLSDIKFIDIAIEWNIFAFDGRFLGGYETNKIKPGSKTYCFKAGTYKDEIREELRNSLKVISEFNRGDSILSEIRVKQILNEITEICHNGCNHSNSMCFISIESNSGKDTATISISDYGIGYYKSLTNKVNSGKIEFNFIDQESFLKLNQSEKNIYSILEAVFYRKNSTEYGLYNVIEEILFNNGTVRIHTENTQLIFRRKDLFYNKDIIANEFVEKSQLVLKGMANIKTSPIRYSSKFNGVHIELQIPLK